VNEDLDALSRNVVSELRVAFPGRELVVVSDGDANGHWDHDRLAQVLSNLVGNAIQHGDTGAPIIVRIDGTDAATVGLHVHNRGTIAPQHLPSLFDPFRRAAAKGSSPGLGLGLYITKLIATAHGGDVSVTSDDEKGTTFSVSLPRGD